MQQENDHQQPHTEGSNIKHGRGHAIAAMSAVTSRRQQCVVMMPLLIGQQFAVQMQTAVKQMQAIV